MSYEEVKYSDGSFRRAWVNGSGGLHREDGPAYIHYFPDGSIKEEWFYLCNVQHRELGPAVIWYNLDGSIVFETFILNGEHLGNNNIGFWVLWDGLTDEQRHKPELLKYLVRFS